MADIIKNDCQGEEPEGKESIPVFLARTSKALYGNVDSLDADDVCRLAELANRFFSLDCQAASHVESVICMRSAHFTGEPPYTGWRGLGKALREDYDDLATLNAQLEEAREIISGLLTDRSEMETKLIGWTKDLLKEFGNPDFKLTVEVVEDAPVVSRARSFLNRGKDNG